MDWLIFWLVLWAVGGSVVSWQVRNRDRRPSTLKGIAMILLLGPIMWSIAIMVLVESLVMRKQFDWGLID